VLGVQKQNPVLCARDEASGGARGALAPPTHPEHVEFL